MGVTEHDDVLHAQIAYAKFQRGAGAVVSQASLGRRH